MIGEVLVAARAITQEQLDQALQEQRRAGALLGDVLVSMSALSDDELARALAEEARVPFASLEGAAPDAHAAALVPEDLARRGMFVPVAPRSASRSGRPGQPVRRRRHRRTPARRARCPSRWSARRPGPSRACSTGPTGPARATACSALVDEGLASLDRPVRRRGRRGVADRAPGRRAHRRRRPGGRDRPAPRARRARRARPAPHRRRAARRSTRCRATCSRPWSAGSRSWPASTSPSSGCRRRAASRRRSTGGRSTSACRRSRRCSARRSPSASSSRTSSSAGSPTSA